MILLLPPRSSPAPRHPPSTPRRITGFAQPPSDVSDLMPPTAPFQVKPNGELVPPPFLEDIEVEVEVGGGLAGLLHSVCWAALEALGYTVRCRMQLAAGVVGAAASTCGWRRCSGVLCGWRQAAAALQATVCMRLLAPLPAAAVPPHALLVPLFCSSPSRAASRRPVWRRQRARHQCQPRRFHQQPTGREEVAGPTPIATQPTLLLACLPPVAASVCFVRYPLLLQSPLLLLYSPSHAQLPAPRPTLMPHGERGSGH